MGTSTRTTNGLDPAVSENLFNTLHDNNKSNVEATRDQAASSFNALKDIHAQDMQTFKGMFENSSMQNSAAFEALGKKMTTDMMTYQEQNKSMTASFMSMFGAMQSMFSSYMFNNGANNMLNNGNMIKPVTF